MVDSLLKPPPKHAARGRRLVRTVLLGTLAVAVGVYWLADSFGVDRSELIDYLRTSALFVAVFTIAGVAAGGLLWLLKRWFKR